MFDELQLPNSNQACVYILNRKLVKYKRVSCNRTGAKGAEGKWEETNILSGSNTTSTAALYTWLESFLHRCCVRNVCVCVCVCIYRLVYVFLLCMHLITFAYFCTFYGKFSFNFLANILHDLRHGPEQCVCICINLTVCVCVLACVVMFALIIVVRSKSIYGKFQVFWKAASLAKCRLSNSRKVC